MKRLNDRECRHFQRGDVREDGYIFYQYHLTQKDKNGFYLETWYHPDKFENAKNSRLVAERKNPHVLRARNSKYRCAKIQRTQKWFKDYYAEEVKAIYKFAETLKDFTGLNWDVDHIVPLQGKLVSGLHVPWNLEVILKVDNARKSNKFEPC